MSFRNYTHTLIGALALAGVVSSGAIAHHTYVTKYNPKKLITLRGVVGSVNYFNPHIFFNFTATSKKGGTTTWRVETESIPKARARGLTPAILKQGAQATITGWMARDNTAQIGLRSIRFKNGTTVKMRGSPR